MKIFTHCGQDSETGDAADTYSSAAEKSEEAKNIEISSSAASETNTSIAMHRSESYRHIIEAEDENAGFINRFKPNMKFINIEHANRSKTVKM